MSCSRCQWHRLCSTSSINSLRVSIWSVSISKYHYLSTVGAFHLQITMHEYHWTVSLDDIILLVGHIAATPGFLRTLSYDDVWFALKYGAPNFNSILRYSAITVVLRVITTFWNRVHINLGIYMIPGVVYNLECYLGYLKQGFLLFPRAFYGLSMTIRLASISVLIMIIRSHDRHIFFMIILYF